MTDLHQIHECLFERFSSEYDLVFSISTLNPENLILFLSRFLGFPRLFLTIDFIHLPYEMFSLWNSIKPNQFVSLLISCIHYITLNAYFHCILFLFTWKNFPLMTFSFLCLKFGLNNHRVHLLKTDLFSRFWFIYFLQWFDFNYHWWFPYFYCVKTN
jgi:hypothetical protein